MYKSPITLISNEIQLNLEDGMYKAVKQIGIEVDKDELISALKYDRGQYEKGYADAKAEQKSGKWLWDFDGRAIVIQCSECGLHYDHWAAGFNYCPNCGARMEEEKTNNFILSKEEDDV